MISEIAVSYLLFYGLGNPCSCLVLQLHILGTHKSDSTLYGATPHTAAFYIQFVLAPLPGSKYRPFEFYLSTLLYKQRRSPLDGYTTTVSI